jgi:hypothetical protein
MAMEDFDIDRIDSAVNKAFGGKSTAPKPGAPKQADAGPSFEGMNPDLAQRLQQAREAYKQRYKADLPITSGVRTREHQQDLYNRWKAGEKGIYEPINPADYPKQKTFHSDAVDISTSVPESFLNEFGIHRPMGKKDPVHAVVMTKAPTKAATTTQPNTAEVPSLPEVVVTASRDDTGIENIDKLMNPEAINAAVDTAIKEPPKKGKVATKVGSFFGDVKAGAAGLADTVIGGIQSLPGMAVAETGYATALAGEALGLIEPGRAERGRAAVYKKFVEPYQRPVGEALGVTESPAYKGEASQQLMQFIGENIGKGVDFLSEKTGLPKAQIENMINTGLFALPGAVKGVRGTKVGQAVEREVGYAGEAVKQAGGKVVGALGEVTPAPIQRAVTGTVEAIAPGTIKPKPAPVVIPQPGPTNVAPFQPGRASVGAAGVPDATIIQQALQTATPEFQALYGKMDLNKVNTPVVLRHLEGDALPIPVRLTEGEATGNPVLLSEEANLRGKYPELAMRKNEANQALIENIPAIKELAAPDVYATRTIESSQAVIDAYKNLDKNTINKIEEASTNLKNAAGGDLPVDAPTLLKNIDNVLKKELLLTDGKSISQYAELVDLAKTGQMTFDQYLAMYRNLSKLSAKAPDGNVRYAAGLMVKELDKLPLINETAALKILADKRRALARDRFDALKKDPAYKAAVDDAVPADKYFDKFVINGVNKNINTMIDTLGRDSVAHQHIKAGTINHLSDKAGVIDGRGNFSQANYNKTLKKLDDVNNFGVIFDPDSQLRLKTLGNVAAYTQFQPRGHYINNSNTLVGYLANKAAGGAEAAGNVAGFKFMGGIPVGTMVRQRVQESKAKTRAQRALEPGAGSTLKDISEGKK